MCEQPETNMVSGSFHAPAAGRVQAAFPFCRLPFAGRLKTKFAYKKAACTLLFKVQAAFGD
ncbi:hypothetical protein HMPREF9098_2319 [Kingella denitrificans ATCC 33394]|uniref:Uncharacterized protein n=1 Tax=Kingella denitrificans ATCC 33394 TaxID=888741 RepID=F0F2I4_9NEIS|nr:hypothetical protein HMPREF9098_2319 [Kingella denitrificans ATCC 33394]